MIGTEIYNQLLGLRILETAGFVTSLAGVWLAAREKVWTWPVSIVGVLLSMVVFYEAKLYADVLLQVFYIGASVYGWYEWLFGGQQKTTLPVSRAPKKVLAGTLLLALVLSPAVGYLFDAYTQAEVPYQNSALAVLSLLTTYLMARKYLENWLLWVAIDFLYAWLYASQGLYLYSLLYLIFSGLAVAGYRQWKVAATASASQS